MAKQKILIFVGILVILLIAGAFYFLIKKDSKIKTQEEIPNTPLTQEEKDARSFQTLNSFQPPSDIKSEAEARKDLNKGTPPKEIQNKSEEESRQDLSNITQ